MRPLPVMSRPVRPAAVAVAAASAAVLMLPTASAAVLAHDGRAVADASCEGYVTWTSKPGLTFTDKGAKSLDVRGTYVCEVPGHTEISGATVEYTAQASGGCPEGITAKVQNAKIMWSDGRTSEFDQTFQLSPLSYVGKDATVVSGLFQGGSMVWSAEHVDFPALNCALPTGVEGGKMRQRFTITGVPGTAQAGGAVAAAPSNAPAAG